MLQKDTEQERAMVPVPATVCVDLDGTLIATDLLWESLIEALKRHPWRLLALHLWMARGRATLKQKLAEAGPVDPRHLPYREEVLRLIEQLRKDGAGRVVLATASHERLAQPVAEHLGIFDEVLATTDDHNLKGLSKAEVLRQRYGDDILYIGDHAADLAVWAKSKAAVVVGSRRLAERAARVTQVREVIVTRRASLKDYWRALRPHHWSKNVLLLLPLVLAHRWQAEPWVRTVAGMALFGLAASAIYVMNDLLDLPSDRKHPWKRQRPFAAGRLSIGAGVAMAPLLLLGGIGGGALYLGWRFGVAVGFYCVLSLTYSLALKRMPLADVFVLTSFYGIRIITGALITRTPLSSWFLIFSMFFFFSLALAKRYSELHHAHELLKTGNSGRGYQAEDQPLLAMMGVASGFASIIVFSFYTRSPEVSGLYPHPWPLGLIAPLLLYWMMRVWLRAGRGELQEDPVTLALSDPMSYAVGVACIFCILLTFIWR